VTLGCCSWAVQWLSRAPAPIPNRVQVAYSKDAAVLDQYVRQAAAAMTIGSGAAGKTASLAACSNSGTVGEEPVS
jgi:hypothetical protein